MTVTDKLMRVNVRGAARASDDRFAYLTPLADLRLLDAALCLAGLPGVFLLCRLYCRLCVRFSRRLRCLCLLCFGLRRPRTVCRGANVIIRIFIVCFGAGIPALLLRGFHDTLGWGGH